MQRVGMGWNSCRLSQTVISSGSVVKNPPPKQETQVRSLHQEDPLEKELATHSSLLTWEIPWTEEPGGSSPKSRIESNATKWLSRYTCIFTALIFLYANSNEWSSQSLSPWTVFFFFLWTINHIFLTIYIIKSGKFGFYTEYGDAMWWKLYFLIHHQVLLRGKMHNLSLRW